MLHFISTSLLEANSQTVVNTVNTVGVMGKGLAKHFGDKYPNMFKEYKRYCTNGDLDIGKLWLWKEDDQWILNFPTKKHWRNPSKLQYIELGLKKFVDKYEEKGITEISFPRLGCGNGGLDWQDVRPLMEKYLAKLPITVYIHDFQADIGAPEHNIPLMPSSFLQSFDAFLEDIKTVISQNHMRFKKISNQSEFIASFSENDGLMIKHDTELGTSIPKEDLYEAWQMLTHGPVTETRLVGKARDEAPYIISLLATLPYTRAIELRQNDSDISAIAVELIQSFAQIEQLSFES